MATTATEHPNAKIFREGYDAFNRGDMDTLRRVIAQDVVWHATGNNRFAGDKRGLDATLAFFGELAQSTGGSFHIDVHDIIANDEHAVAIVTQHLEQGSTKYESRAAHTVHVRDGKITESWFFAEDPYTFDRLFA